jgi:hypothetical protein
MAITINTILTWCGITNAGQRTRIVAELLSAPEGLMHLNDESTEAMQATFRDYSRRDAADGKIIFNRVQQKRLISLKDWVKDKATVKDEVTFDNDTTRGEFIIAIEEASERKECQTNQKKTGDTLITATFQVQLETASQWDRWVVELKSNLKMIIGAKGIALSYVIRENDAPNLEEQETWEERASLAVPLSGNAYAQDRLTVHNIILRNIADGSDAFTYVKPHLKKDNGRTDILSLRERYENPAMQEQYVNEAKRTLETLTYRNERALKFEKFVANFVKAVDELEKRGRGMHNANIVEMIWRKMTNPELNQYVIALKVQFQRQPREYQQVLQDIASQIPTLPISTFRNTSEVGRVSEQGHEKPDCPETGAHDADGKLFIGKYPPKYWHKIKEHWSAIRAERSKQGVGNANYNGQFHEKKREQAELQSQISELHSKKARMEATIASITVDGSVANVSELGGSRAGDSFGGRSEREQHKRK